MKFVWSSTSILGLFVLFASIPQFCNAKGEDDRGRLISTLFKNYDNRNYGNDNVVKFGLTLLKFNADPENKIFEADAWLQMEWTDSRFVWDPETFGSIDKLSVSESEVWRPDMALYNTADQLNLLPCTSTRVVIKNDGSVMWVPPCHFKSVCNVKPDLLESGAQNCTLMFGPWTLDGNTVDIKLRDTKADTSYLRTYSDLELTGNIAYRNSTIYPCCPEPYVSATFDFSIKKIN